MGLIFFVKNFAKILRSFWGNTDDEILFVIIYISYLHTSFKEMKPHSNLVKYPIIYKVLYISFGAGSIKDLPSFGFSSLIIAIVSWLGYRAIWSCYSSDSRAGEDPTRYAGEGASNFGKWLPVPNSSLSWLGHKNSAPKLANHIFQWGFQPPCHWTSLIFLRIQGTVYSSQDVLSFNKRIFEGRVTLELVISRVFFREPKIKDFSASKSVNF